MLRERERERERDSRSQVTLYLPFLEEFHVAPTPPNFYQNRVPLSICAFEYQISSHDKSKHQISTFLPKN